MRSGWAPLLSTALAAAAYLTSAPLTAHGLRAWLGAPCESTLLEVTCKVRGDGGFDWRVYLVAGASVAVTMLATRLLLRQRVVYPFLMLFGVIALAAVAYDGIFRNALVAGPKLTNDTFNVLRFVVFASFVLTFILARGSSLPLVGVILAIIASFAGTFLVMAGFLLIQEQVMGTLELFLLYVAYAFGGFTFHLMTVSLLIARARPPPLMLETDRG